MPGRDDPALFAPLCFMAVLAEMILLCLPLSRWFLVAPN